VNKKILLEKMITKDLDVIYDPGNPIDKYGEKITLIKDGKAIAVEPDDILHIAETIAGKRYNDI
jgi:hypothetical protein